MPCLLSLFCFFVVVVFLFFFLVLFISMQVVQNFRTFQWFVLTSIGFIMKDVVEREQQTSTSLCYSLFSTWSVFFWYTFVFVIAAKKCHNLWTCTCICGIYHIVLISGWHTVGSPLCRQTLCDAWAQDTKPKACCHLLELAVIVITSNTFVKLSHLTTLLADDLTISHVPLGLIIGLVTVRWRCTKRASRFSTI